MIALIRGEAIKVRSTRTAIGFAIAGAIIALIYVLGLTLAGHPVSIEDKRLSVSVGGLTSVLFVIFGIVGATGEYRHRTVAPAVLIAPDRVRLLLARTLAYAVTAAAVAALMVVVSLAIALPILAGDEGPALGLKDALELLGGGALGAALAAIIGVGLGALIGNQVGAVLGFVLYFFILEFTTIPIISEEIFKYTIFRTEFRIAGLTEDPTLSYLGSVGVLVAWGAIALGLGLLRERTREVT